MRPVTEHVPNVERTARARRSILEAAARLFGADGYDAVGIRDIASAAEVNPALITRHFGSKENLFLEAVNPGERWERLLDGPIADLGPRVVESVLRDRRDGLEVFGATIRASARSDIRDHLRSSIVQQFATPLIERLPGPDAELRAHLFAAQLIGLMTALTVYDDGSLMDAPTADVVALYGGGLQRLLTGP